MKPNTCLAGAIRGVVTCYHPSRTVGQFENQSVVLRLKHNCLSYGLARASKACFWYHGVFISLDSNKAMFICPSIAVKDPSTPNSRSDWLAAGAMFIELLVLFSLSDSGNRSFFVWFWYYHLIKIYKTMRFSAMRHQAIDAKSRDRVLSDLARSCLELSTKQCRILSKTTGHAVLESSASSYRVPSIHPSTYVGHNMDRYCASARASVYCAVRFGIRRRVQVVCRCSESDPAEKSKK